MKFLIVGLGSIGQRHLRNLHRLGETDVLAYRARNLPLPEGLEVRVTDSLDDALDQCPDAVIVTNPTSFHMPVALSAARRGCHLFIEKPLSHNLDGVAELEELVKKNRLQVLIGYHLRFHPDLCLIKTLLEEGAIGTVLSARIQVGEYLPGWHPYEDYRNSYSARSDLGGGAVLTLSHELDFACWFFGEVEKVSAFTASRSSLDMEVEDTAQILLRFKSDLLVQIHIDYIQRPPSRSCQIIGEDGQIVWDYYEPSVRLYEASQDRWKTFPIHKDFERNEMFMSEMQHFLDCLEGRAESQIPIETGRQVLELALGIKKSAQTERQYIPGEFNGG